METGVELSILSRTKLAATKRYLTAMVTRQGAWLLDGLTSFLACNGTLSASSFQAIVLDAHLENAAMRISGTRTQRKAQ